MLEDFIENTNNCTSKDEIFDLYKKKMQQFGLNNVFYVYNIKHGKEQQEQGFRHSYPDQWISFYIDNNYYQEDPVALYAMNATQPFFWHDLDVNKMSAQQKKIMQECEDAGLGHGIAVPLHSKLYESCGVGLATDKKKNLDFSDNILRKIKFFSEQFHYSYQQLDAKNNLPQPVQYPLTEQERNILQWFAVGKTADEIGTILHISLSTVKFHLKNIYQKLNSHSKSMTIIKAIKLGLIDLDKMKI